MAANLYRSKGNECYQKYSPEPHMWLFYIAKETGGRGL